MSELIQAMLVASVPGILALILAALGFRFAREEREVRLQKEKSLSENTDIDSLQKLTAAYRDLSDELDDVKTASRDEIERLRKDNEEGIRKLREQYENKVADLERRLSDLERERTELLIENRLLRKKIGE